MANHTPKEGFGTAAEVSHYAGINRNQVGDYRSRKKFDEKDYYKVGNTFYYHLVNCTEVVNTKIRGKSGKAATKEEQAKLDQESIPAKAISEAKKAHFDAKKKELEYNRAAQNVLDVGEFQKDLDEEAREIRDTLASIAARISPMLVSMEDVTEIEALIESEIRTSLHSLFSRFIDG